MARNIAMTWAPSAFVTGPFNIVAYGNSLTGGWASPDNYPAALATLRPADTITNLGTANQFTDQMLANWTTDVLPLASGTKKNVCIWWESVDSIHDHAVTNAQELVKLQSARDLCHAHNWLIVVGAICPNIDPPATPSDDATFNALLRANLSGFNACFSPDLVPHLADPNNATYFQNAGSSVSVHLTALGYTAELAPCVNAALNAMTP